MSYFNFPKSYYSGYGNYWANWLGTSKKEKINIEITKSCMDKINGWCKAATSEVSGMGLVKKEGNTYKIYDVFILKQECGFAETTLNKDAVAKLMQEIAMKEGTLKNLRFWWHTHYNFNTFFSGTDISTMEELSGNASWFLALVTNQNGDQMWLDRKGTEQISAYTDGNKFKLTVINDHQPNNTNFKKDIKKYVKKAHENWTSATSEGGDCWVFDKKTWTWHYKPTKDTKPGPVGMSYIDTYKKGDIREDKPKARNKKNDPFEKYPGWLTPGVGECLW